jgi:hypothetical protein
LSSQIAVSPLQRDDVHGFSFALNNHGVIHYVTWPNHLIDIALQCGIIFSVPVVFLFALWIAFSSRK